jgi:hypothetical protein
MRQMEQYEYARLLEYSLHNDHVDARQTFAYLLQTENSTTLLQQTSLLATLNEIGRQGWLVYEVIHPNQPHSARGSMSEAYLDDFRRRHGWRPKMGVLGGQRSLRRILPVSGRRL